MSLLKIHPTTYARRDIHQIFCRRIARELLDGELVEDFLGQKVVTSTMLSLGQYMSATMAQREPMMSMTVTGSYPQYYHNDMIEGTLQSMHEHALSN
jgi:hypothetical protein